MNRTLNEQIDSLKADFRKLSKSRQSALRRKAYRLTIEQPHMADHNGFWRGLSARHVLAAFAGK